MSDTISKGDHTRIIPVKFGSVWLNVFRGEDLMGKNMTYDVKKAMLAKTHRAVTLHKIVLLKIYFHEAWKSKFNCLYKWYMINIKYINITDTNPVS